MARFLYTVVVVALLPWAILHLLWRSRKQPEYLRHWGERFGVFPAVACPGLACREFPFGGRQSGIPGTQSEPAPTLWLHAVSVGETRAAQPLVAALRERYPDHRILFTHMTPTGRATSEALFGDTVDRIYLPYDTPWATRRFLRHYRPEFGLIMETELWPNLIAACKEADIPLYLVNARLSERSARRYASFPALAREALQGLTAVGAQSADDAARLEALGAGAVTVTGNVKFDIAAAPGQLELGGAFRAGYGTRPIWLAASTREGEEALILDAWRNALPGDGALLVLVPRHPQRFDEVARLAQERGFVVQRRSAAAAVGATTQVLIGDSMGEMFAFYASVDLAFIGGSLLDFGGQNLIEAAACGTPILIGPSTRNFAEAAREAIACGAARSIGDADDLVRQAMLLLGNAETRRRMGAAGRAFAGRHRGATARTLAVITAGQRPEPS
jgi:3-deoxy-D-manno-octulosonic-acid transferase